MMLAGLVLCVAFAGCSSEPPRLEPLTDEELARLPAVSPDELKALLDAQKGKVVVMAIWSVRREACLAMYPKLADLCKGGAEPVVIAVNIDNLTDVRKKVFPLLEQHKPKFLNRVCRADPDALAAFVDPSWMGRVPAIVLFDRDGSRTETLLGENALTAAQQRLRELLPR